MTNEPLPDSLAAAVAEVTMPAGAAILADLIARHVAGLVHPVTSTPGVVDADAVAAHSALLEAFYPKVLWLLKPYGDDWCLAAAADARATSLGGIVLDHVFAREPLILPLIVASGGLVT